MTASRSATGQRIYAAASEPILRVARELAGEEHILEIARTFTAWATGSRILAAPFSGSCSAIPVVSQEDAGLVAVAGRADDDLLSLTR